jgi:predicted transcriptional regulator
MNIRMERHIKQSEYLRELEATFGSLRALEKTAKGDSKRRPILEEWKHYLSHPERNEETIAIQREMIFHDFELFLEIITPQRLRLLEFLRSNPNVESLNELAKGLDRDYRNVHEDAKRLALAGVLDLETLPNRVVPRVIAQSIEVVI